MKKLALLILALAHTILTNTAVRAQDAHFSQYYASSLYLNPAFAGSESEMTLNSNFRTQWRSVTVPYNTNQVSAILPIYLGAKDADIKRHVGGMGVSFYNDQAGDAVLRNTGGNLTLGYVIRSANNLNMFSFGGQFGFVQRSIDLNSAVWGDQLSNYGYNPTVSQGNANISTSKWIPSVNAGVMWSYNPSRDYLTKGISAFSGVAVSHLNMPNESFTDGEVSRRPMLIKYHGGLEFPVSDKLSIAPNALVMAQSNLLQVNAGAYLNYKLFDAPVGLLANTDLVFGTWYRLHDAFIFALGLNSTNYTLGFSYDVNSSSLNNISSGRGAYELSFSIRQSKMSKNRRRFDTPRI